MKIIQDLAATYSGLESTARPRPQDGKIKGSGSPISTTLVHQAAVVVVVIVVVALILDRPCTA